MAFPVALSTTTLANSRLSLRESGVRQQIWTPTKHGVLPRQRSRSASHWVVPVLFPIEGPVNSRNFAQPFGLPRLLAFSPQGAALGWYRVRLRPEGLGCFFSAGNLETRFDASPNNPEAHFPISNKDYLCVSASLRLCACISSQG